MRDRTGGLHVDGEDHWQTGDLQPEGDASVFDQIVQRGVIELLTRAFPGRIELHSPWHTGREVSVLFRGDLDVAEAQALLDQNGSSDLRLIDNGYLGGLPTGGTGSIGGWQDSELDDDLGPLRSYHLAPEAGSKAAAAARHRGAGVEGCWMGKARDV